MTNYTREKLLAAFKAGQRNFVGVDLRGADLREADLAEADLRRANLYGADLSGADLRRATLYGATLYGANLSGANLSGADLSGADLYGATLYGANLSGANLSGADLSGADLSGADLRRANLRRADLRRADLSGADLRRANLREAYPIGCLGLYSVRPPFMSSRNDALYAGVFERDGGLVLLFSAGCQHQQTAAELREKVRETHGMNAHAVQYEAAITFIEVCFASDMAEGRFAVKEAQP